MPNGGKKSIRKLRADLETAIRTRDGQNKFLKRDLGVLAAGESLSFKRSLGLHDRGRAVGRLNRRVGELQRELDSRMRPPLQREKDR